VIRGAFTLMLRSLRVDDRMLRTHLFRLMFVGLMLVMLSSAQLTASFMGAPGLQFFRMIVYLNAVFISLAGISHFSTPITEEKEERTLGLLQMADLGPASILLGKSVPRIVTAVVFLSAQFPFTLLAITLGGVTISQVLAAYWSLLAHLLLVAGLGLFCSVVCRRSASAAAATTVVLIVFLMIVPPLYFTLGGFGTPTGIQPWVLALCDWLYHASVFMHLGTTLTTGFAESAFSYQVKSNIGAALFFFAVSWLVFERFNGQERSTSPTRGLLLRRNFRIRLLRTPRAWSNALIWKDFHFIAGGPSMSILKFLLYGSVVAFCGYSFFFDLRGNFTADDFRGFVVVTSFMACLVELSLFASRVFHVEYRWQTLPNLMGLPRSAAYIGYSKVVGCMLGVVPAATILLIGLAVLPGHQEIFEGSLGFWVTMAWFGVFLHLISFLSLYVKWGALPLAIAIMFLGYFGFLMFSGIMMLVFQGPMGALSDGTIEVVLIMIAIALVAVIQLATRDRLTRLAAR